MSREIGGGLGATVLDQGASGHGAWLAVVEGLLYSGTLWPPANGLTYTDSIRMLRCLLFLR